ncbi:chemotaxis protein CheB [Agaribacterium haliotis]|uniref:chemotaxis protein CheB n=1 Tax=Agaribacterium haliotis TaxID=2013869 RepID=UPI001178CBCD|nr:chemotaxis protein CheB [Agaribacterium haliotis]
MLRSSTEIERAALRLGLLADSSSELGALVAVARATSHKIVCSALTRSFSVPLRDDVDAWVLRIAEHCDATDAIVEWLSEHDIPMVIQDVSASAAINAGEFDSKLRDCVSAYQGETRLLSKPSQVWVLAASTGGPEVLNQFFKLVDDEQVKRFAFVIAQHIDVGGLPALFESLARNTSLLLKSFEPGMAIEAGSIYVVSPAREFSLSDSQRLVMTGGEWRGPYQPSINQVIAKVAKAFRAKAGAVVFTGMGDDGAAATSLLRGYGGKVAIQEFSSCTVDSMPRSVKERGYVNFCGDVAALANYISKRALAAR